MTDPSVACRNARHERFVQLIVEGGASRTKVDAYRMAYGKDLNQPTTASDRVSATRLFKQTKERVAYLLAERAKQADSTAREPEPITAQRLLAIMDEVGATLKACSQAAKAAGQNGLANSLRQELVVHVGRSERLESRIQPAKNFSPQFDAELLLQRLDMCQCDE